MKYYLGIDGGGTTTTFLLCDEMGNVLARVKKGCLNHFHCGVAIVRETLFVGTKECCEIAKITQSQITAIFCGTAGFGEDTIKDAALVSIGESIWGKTPHKISNDTVNAHAGSLGGMVGINIISGTGSIAYGIDETGASARAGGWHYLFGSDEGSANWIGSKLILEFSKQSDGRVPKTQLYSFIKDKYSLESDYHIISTFLNRDDGSPRSLAVFALDATFLASSGDKAAQKIFTLAAEELVDLAVAVKNKLNFTKPIKVSYSGGVFNSGMVLLSPFKAAIESHKMEFTPPIAPPECGCVILATLICREKVDCNFIKNMLK